MTDKSSHNQLPGLSLNHIVQRDPEIVAAEADKDLVMVSITNGKYYGVSEIARDIWERIEYPKKISELIDGLTETYDIERATCEVETLSFLEDLRGEGLLRVENDPIF